MIGFTVGINCQDMSDDVGPSAAFKLGLKRQV